MYYVSDVKPLSFDEARMYAFSLGNGWRIPKPDEMQCLKVHYGSGDDREATYWVDDETAAVYEYGKFTGDYTMKFAGQKASLIIIKGEHLPYPSMRVRTYICPIAPFVQKPAGLHPLLKNLYPEWFEEESA